jgi:hypothetical protein
MTVIYVGLQGDGLGGGEAATKPIPVFLKHCHSERNEVE